MAHRTGLGRAMLAAPADKPTFASPADRPRTASIGAALHVAPAGRSPVARCKLWFFLKALQLPARRLACAGAANGSHPWLRLDALERSR